MPTISEIQVILRKSLFNLLSLEKLNAKHGIEVIGLSTLISETKAGLTKEEVAYVKELVDNGE